MAPHESAIESSRYLGESCGHLHLGVAYEPPYFHCNIFEMASSYTWFLKFRLNLETMVEAFPEIDLTSEIGNHPMNALCVIPSDKDDQVFKLVAVLDWTIAIFHDMNDKTLTKLCDLKPCSRPHRYCCDPDLDTFPVFQYLETLACV
ncbi:hypothetical protein COLO4_38558 [Corchorus olitorius]|uniref:Uncharacterized protein n=1 Tax=Corchorus olitorius TaxID=93759 RepID=A0A1R3FUA1_9ROSI|nr:hypothetical protein COLO4_38558 [Corchorus olitorius]